ncbi:UTRA domain-containing protein [Marinomonas sp. 15G1-11]|uniref:UTRA domain-containing protein n=1 Tax=Marinomonas phaeophyticola TaxID=3004091 RepID=A0ABT4JRE5_9GAMM|nr:UTRA domain-containing protein [Marinomonas sp. 15G1-11]MCZ2720951.1 UTRA domain-containing protein [Marinomonas sp. 15G1-11]
MDITKKNSQNIKEILRDQISRQLLLPLQKIPSERELSELFSLTRISVKSALHSLEVEGLIYRENRRGWFVSPPRIEYNPLSRGHFHQMISDQQRVAKTLLLNVKSMVAPSAIATTLKLSKPTPIHIIERLRYIDGRAVLFVENCLISQYFPDILSEDLSQSLTELYAKKYGFRNSCSHFDFIPTSAPEHVIHALNMHPGQQVLKICRVNYNQHNNIIDCEFEYWRPDAVMVSINNRE